MMNYQNNTYRKENCSQIPPTESPSYQGFLNTLVKGNEVILLDACTVMKGEPFEQLLKDLILILQRNNKQITMLQSVMEELRSFVSSADTAKRAKATNGLELLRVLQIAGLVVLRGSPNAERSGGEGIIKYVSKNIYDKNICVLTQSGDLAADCALFSQIRSCPMPYKVTVKRISNQYGQLNSFDPAGPRPEATRVTGTEDSCAKMFRILGL